MLEGQPFLAVVADVAVPEDVDRLVAETLSEFGGVDVLCHNAGGGAFMTIEDSPKSVWDEVIATTLTSAFLLVKACLSPMRERGYGRIVLTSSITGNKTGFAGMTHFGASKAGLTGFMRGAALELAPFGITINAIEPGFIRTQAHEGIGAEALAAIEANIPLGSIGEPDDVANAALFLAAEESRFITGHSMVVDGGLILPELPLTG